MPSETQFWQISPGRKEDKLWPEFSKNDIIAIGWDKLGDLREYSTIEELEKELRRRWNEGLNSARSCWYFSRSIKKNDIVVAKYGSSKEIYGVGKVTEEYDFKNQREYFKNVIGVHWYVKFDDSIKVDTPKNFVQWTVHTLSEKRYLEMKNSIIRDYPDQERNFHMMETAERPLISRDCWVEKTIVKGRADRETGEYSLGKVLWSPQRDRRGADIYKNMREIRERDFVLHLVDNKAIIGISIVDKECNSDFFVPKGTKWDDGTGNRPGYLVTLKGYRQLKNPIHRTDFLRENYRPQLIHLIDEGHHVFYDRYLSLREGAYLTKVPSELLGIFNEIYKRKTGEELPYLSEIERERVRRIGTKEGKYAVLWSANMDLDPNVIVYNQRQIRRAGATYWGVGFKIDKGRFSLPINGYLYTTDRGKITHIAKIDDIETYDSKQMPKEPRLRPPEYRDEVTLTYFRISELESLPVEMDVHDFQQWNGKRVIRPPQNYVLVMEPTAPRYAVLTEMDQRIIAHLITGRNIIFYGPPGTGKTRRAVEIANLFCGEAVDRFSFETANAEWTAYDVVGGPTFSGKTTLKIKPGFLTLAAKKCFNSLEASGVPYWLIIDEINRANLDLAFGKVFSLLDVEYREQPIFDESELVGMENADEYRGVTIPAGFRVLATMNTYDTALLFSLGYAFRRRFAFVEVGSPFIEKVVEDKYELNEQEWVKLELSSKTQVEEIMNEIDDWILGKAYLQLSPRLKNNLKLLTNFDLAETLRAINEDFKDGKWDPFNPYMLACKLSEEITQKGIVEAGYAQAVDVIKYTLIYAALFPESDERETIVRALDEAVKAYFVPHIEYYLPRARRKMTIGGKEEEEEAIKKLKDFEGFVEKLGLIRSKRKIQEIISRLKMGETRIF